MKTKASIEALVRRNAAACEHARKKRCHCQCQGAKHRQPHSEEWIQWAVARAQQAEAEDSAIREEDAA